MTRNGQRAQHDIGRRRDGNRRSRQDEERPPDGASAAAPIQADRHAPQEFLGRQGFPGFGEELCQGVVEIAHDAAS
jgi:hypothetical protein